MKRTLVDRLLDATQQPVDLEGLGEVTRDTPGWRRQISTASFALDLVGAALREIAGLRPPAAHGTHCLDAREVLAILGDPPRRTTPL